MFGSMRIDAVKTAINFTRRSHFVMLYVRKRSLVLDFASEAPLMSERIFRRDKLGPRLYLNYVRLTTPEDIDEELLSWLKEAYKKAD